MEHISTIDIYYHLKKEQIHRQTLCTRAVVIKATLKAGGGTLKIRCLPEALAFYALCI